MPLAVPSEAFRTKLMYLGMATPTKIHITTIIMINSISVNPHLFLDIFTSNNNLSFSIQIVVSKKRNNAVRTLLPCSCCRSINCS